MELASAKVKGTVLLDYVRLIRANSDKNWDKYLEKEDWDIINGRILASLWYPYDIYVRCGKAVFYEIAGGNLNIVRQFGRFNADTLFKGTYKGILELVVSRGGGVIRFAEHYAAMAPTLYNFAKVSVDKVSEKKAKLHVKVDLDPTHVLIEPFFNQFSGTVERLVELAGGKNVKVSYSTKLEERDLCAELDISWE